MIELVPFEERHKKDIIRNLNNINLAKWLLAPPYPYTESDADWFLEKCSLLKLKKCIEESINAIEKDGVFIGGISIRTEKDGKAHTGYYIDENHWNKGYGTLALKKILKYGFEEMNVKELRAMIFEGNTASEKLLMKCGFKFENNSDPVIRIGKEFKTKYYVISVADYSEISGSLNN